MNRDKRPQIKPTPAFIARLPKTDLHVHLDGSLRLETIIDFAHEQGVELPADDPAGLAKAIHMGEICHDLNDYLKAFDVTLAVLQDEGALYRAAYELAEDLRARTCASWRCATRPSCTRGRACP